MDQLKGFITEFFKSKSKSNYISQSFDPILEFKVLIEGESALAHVVMTVLIFPSSYYVIWDSQLNKHDKFTDGKKSQTMFMFSLYMQAV